MTYSNEDIVKYRLHRSRETLREAKIMVDQACWNAAINRLYYACFYAVIGLLQHRNIKVKTHKGARILFNLHFIKTGLLELELGELYTNLFDQRNEGDYEDLFNVDKETVLLIIDPVERFINGIEKIIIN